MLQPGEFKEHYRGRKDSTNKLTYIPGSSVYRAKTNFIPAAAINLHFSAWESFSLFRFPQQFGATCKIAQGKIEEKMDRCSRQNTQETSRGFWWLFFAHLKSLPSFPDTGHHGSLEDS